MLVVAADILQHQRFGMVKHQDAAQHVVVAGVAHEVGVRTGIARGKPEVMVCETPVLRDVWTGLGEHENTGLAIVADLVVDQRGPAERAVDNHAGENAFGRAAPADGAGGVQDVQHRILVAADIPKGDPRDAAAGDVL